MLKEKKYKYISRKVIIFVSVTFLITALVLTFAIYSYFENYKKKQIESFSTNAFISFGHQLDEIFLSIEKSSEAYLMELMEIIDAEVFSNQYSKITRTLLHSNTYITSVTVYFPDNSKNLFSYNYYTTNNMVKELEFADIENIRTDTLIKTIIENENKCWFILPHPLSINLSNDSANTSLIGTFAIPIIYEEEKVGIIFLSFRMAMLDDLMLKFNIGWDSYNVILASNGNIIVHPLKKYLMKPTNYGLNTSLSINSNNAETNLYKKFETFYIDSLGEFKCENSIALSYRLWNDWQLLTIFENSSLFSKYHFWNFWNFILIFILCGAILFSLISIIGINAILNNFNQLVKRIVYYQEYDILDWNLSVIQSNDDIEIISQSLIKLHKAYTNVQNIYIDMLSENEKLILDKQQMNQRVEKMVKEETTAIMEQNQELITSLVNMSEFIQLGKLMCSTLSIEEISKAIFAHLEKLIPIEIFGIYIYNEEKSTLECDNGIENGKFIPPFSVDIVEKNTLEVKCFDNNETIVINNFDIETKQYLLVTSYNKLTLCSSRYYNTILTENGDVKGVFTIQCKEKGVFRNFNFEIFDTLKNYLNMILNNILTYRKLKESLIEMEHTQANLIQSERMASVGQLSAGIAHEIKNPLNFVINFSELSNTLVNDIYEKINEYKTKADQETFEDIEDLISDMRLNLTKIYEHSKRVDKIVKNMLVHANNKSDEFSATDINNLIEEYAQLAYEGVRSTNQMLNVNIHYNFDINIKKIEAMPNNLSRVVINMITNACYAISEKIKKVDDMKNYHPEINITTFNLSDKFIEIKIKDNGMGISEESRNKIFTPFFTTKSTGVGTGLGLSISYNIITQEHKGEISFRTEEGKYTEFIIKLPKKQTIPPLFSK